MTDSRGGRPRSESSRQSILAATQKLLAEQGYDGLTFEKVAAAAGVGKQTIYRWWSSKGALVADSIAEDGSSLAMSVPIPDTGDVAADIESWLGELVGFAADPSAGALLRGLIAATADSPEVADRFNAQVTHDVENALAHRLYDTSSIDEYHEDHSAAVALLGAFVYSLLINRPLTTATIRGLATLIARGVSEN